MRADSSRRAGRVVSPPVRPAIRDLAVVLAVSWLARAVFVAAIGDVNSLDVEYWRLALQAQDEGRNPYETGVLNWPPLWLVVIVAVDYASGLLDVGFWSALRVYLVLVESVLVTVLYLALLAAGGERLAVRRALLVGIALNPIAIILVCLHGNSDVQIGLLVTLAAAALGAHARTRDAVLWLCGCLLLGLGVLAKTVPFVLAPLLAPGARLATSTGRALAAALLVGPALLGMAVIGVLVPIKVWDHVIAYRSTRGFFGIPGVLEEILDVDVDLYARVFALAVLAAIVLLFVRLWRRPPLASPTLFLAVAMGFMAVVAFGPGYGPQYAYWFLPALVATYVLFDAGWRKLLLAAYAVAAVTYVVEYAFVPYLGEYASAVLGEQDWIAEVSDALATPHWLVVWRLPLFAAYVVLIVEGVRRLRTRSSAGSA
jgi:hypothetical protein